MSNNSQPVTKIILGGNVKTWRKYILSPNSDATYDFKVVKIYDSNNKSKVINALSITGSSENIEKFRLETKCVFNSDFAYHK